MVIPKSVHRERMEEKLHSGTVCFGMDYRTETMDCTDSGHYKEIKFRLLEPGIMHSRKAFWGNSQIKRSLFRSSIIWPAILYV